MFITEQNRNAVNTQDGQISSEQNNQRSKETKTDVSGTTINVITRPSNKTCVLREIQTTLLK